MKKYLFLIFCLIAIPLFGQNYWIEGNAVPYNGNWNLGCADTSWDTTYTDVIVFKTDTDTLDIYLTNDTLVFNSRKGSAYLDLSELIVLFGAGTMNIDDHQPATNDSSSSQIGTPSNPYGQGCFAKLIGNKGSDIASATTITITKGMFHTITGTADIDSIVPGTDGQIVLLLFSGTKATNGVVDGKNLKLEGTFAYTPDDILALVCYNDDWYQMFGSAN